MALKNTRATRRLNTKNLSANTDLVFTTEGFSPELRNTLANKKLPKSDCKALARQRGFTCENLAEKHFVSLGYQLFAKRLRTPFAEVDLVFLRDGKLMVVEVKSMGQIDFSLVRITEKQRQRLIRAREWFEGRFAREAALAFAYVFRNGEIFVFNEAGEQLN